MTIRPIAADPAAAAGRPIGGERSTVDEAGRIDASVSGLRQRRPEMSAHSTLSRTQAWLLLGIGAVLLIGLAVRPLQTLIGMEAVVIALYLVTLLYGIRVFAKLLATPHVVRINDDQARAIPDSELPRYSVLVAAYHESEVIGDTIRALEKLEYPADRLEVKLLLEADDPETYAAAVAANPSGLIDIVRVPDVPPRTKPKACNYGLTFTSGSVVTIYDAEDRPEPLQLRRAVVAFANLDPSVACLQAKLEYRNEGQNLITRLFSAEYVAWFSGVIPALVSLRTPVPLGGTSMHIRREVLDAVGGWDPYNVTEDADLGVRLHRMGYRTVLLDSVTSEEANSDFINWVKQRSRWYKGYLQTWLVHMRDPLRLWRELGPAGFLGFNIIVGGTPLFALLNPIFWLLTILWFVGRVEFVQQLFPGWLFYPALFSMLVGNFLAIYRSIVGVRIAGHPGLVLPLLLSPLYWVMMSVAAIRAFIQLGVAPSHWEKTLHGLDRPRTAGSTLPEPGGFR
jgi:cellulose synthase/poly-beta-1,6-N-acetylglucosamine synthase-like glycosyltransferase